MPRIRRALSAVDGTLVAFAVPDSGGSDTGVEQRQRDLPYYDPMIAR